MYRLPSGDEDHICQPELLAYLLSHGEVRVMNGVEEASEDP